MNIFFTTNGPPSLDYHYKKNDDETFGWWGFRNGDTTRNNKNKPPPWLDVTPFDTTLTEMSGQSNGFLDSLLRRRWIETGGW